MPNPKAKPIEKQTFKFSGEFKRELSKDLREVQDNTMKELLEMLKSEIWSNRILSKQKKGSYRRTDILSMIFETEKSYYHGGEYGGIYGNILPDEEKFDKLKRNILPSKDDSDFNEKWQHRSDMWGDDIDMQDYLQLINYGIEDTHSIFGERPPSYFWENFQKIAEENYYNIFYKYCRLKGLRVVDTTMKAYATKRSKRGRKNQSGTIQLPKQYTVERRAIGF